MHHDSANERFLPSSEDAYCIGIPNLPFGNDQAHNVMQKAMKARDRAKLEIGQLSVAHNSELLREMLAHPFNRKIEILDEAIKSLCDKVDLSSATEATIQGIESFLATQAGE